jgi:hypothetical protein
MQHKRFNKMDTNIETISQIKYFGSSEVMFCSSSDFLSDSIYEDRDVKYRPSHFSYVDYTDQEDDSGQHKVRRYAMKMPFPAQLHDNLSRIEEDGLARVVSWQPHGRCFVIHQPKEFCSVVMPAYFKLNKFPSFLRQLNLYGFRRLTRRGPDRGGYYHERFLRNKKLLACRIPRLRIKGTRVRPCSDPFGEPDFYHMPYAVEVKDKLEIQEDLSNMKSVLKSYNFHYMQHIYSSSVSDARVRRASSTETEPLDDLYLRGWITANNQMVNFPDFIGLQPFELEKISNNVEDDFDYGELLIEIFDIRVNIETNH